MIRVHRRQYLQFMLGWLITSNYHSPTIAKSLEIEDIKVTIKVWTAEGKPLDDKSLEQLYFLDLNDEPLFTAPEIIASGTLAAKAPNFPFAIALRSIVPGFGQVVLYADNQGQGYTPADFPLNLNLASASSRLHRVQTYLTLQQQQGFEFSTAIDDRLQLAQQYLERAREASTRVAQMSWCNLSLVASMWAGELAVFSQAQQAIAQREKRTNFLFGGNFFRYQAENKDYNQRFQQLFNFATVPFYWNSLEPQLGQKKLNRVDDMVNWLGNRQLTVKGHPLVYFHEAGTPKWLKDQSFTQVKQLVRQHVLDITSHYQGKIAYYDIINEANNIPWANALKFDRQQFLELTQIAAEACNKGDSQAQRIINHCCTWGENVAYGKPPQDSPYQYLQRCLDAEIPFEIIGLQFYYSHQDMFEINRQLERFSNLKKVIHITELGTSSATTIDENSQLKEPRGLWHKPWSEAIQADWIEQFYTLCYSKPYIEAISWWDLADGGNFWAHGGILKANMEPKLAYYRLQRLIQKWQEI